MKLRTLSISKNVNPMKEITIEKLEKLHKFVLASAAEKSEHNLTVPEAIVLGIFAVFNPENIPMTEEEIQVFYNAYLDWFEGKTHNPILN